MRLLTRGSDGTLLLVDANEDLKQFDTGYAILSHTWGSSNEEVAYTDILEGTARSKRGYAKLDFILECAEQAGLKHAWADTCCIDKRNKTELEKSINLMYQWYAKADICSVYLADFCNSDTDESATVSSFEKSRWFTRGWTLQELLAPRDIKFYDRNRNLIGTRAVLADTISEVTSIPAQVLTSGDTSQCSLFSKFSWSLQRQTTEPEDTVYCLFGLLQVLFPIQYGISVRLARAQLFEALRRQYGLPAVDELRAKAHQRLGHDFMTGDEGPPRVDLKRRLFFDQAYTRRNNIEHEQFNTCGWLLEHAAFKSWLQDHSGLGDGTLLWIKGHPGAGKSTLIRFADRRAIEQQDQQATQISFYFNARGQDMEHTTVGMYRSLLHQLLDSSTRLEQAVRDGIKAGRLQLDEAGVWTIHQLKSIFRLVVLSSVTNIRIFVDALDECSIEEVQDMISFFRELTKLHNEAGRCLHICFASRYYPALTIRGSVEICLDQQVQHINDLTTYVHERLEVQDYHERDEIREQVIRKASGIFLWAVLVVKVLNRALANWDVHQVQSILASMPPELDGVYRRIVGRADRSDWGRFQTCMQLVLFSRRALSADELFAAIAFGSESGSVATTTFVRRQPTEKARFVSVASRGLAELRGRVVQVIHESVRDFFLKHDGASYFTTQGDVDLDKRYLVYDHLKNLCVQVLKQVTDLYLESHRTRPRTINVSSMSRTAMLDRMPFAEHACLQVVYYAEKAAAYRGQEAFIQGHVWEYLWLARGILGLFLPRTSGHTLGPHFALTCIIHEGAIRLLSTVAKFGYPVHGALYEITSLQYALECGWFDIALQLLCYGADPNVTWADGDTCLTRCIRRGDSATEDWYKRKQSYATEVVIWRSENGKIMDNFLLPQDQKKLLMLSWEYSQENVVQILLYYGASPNTFGATARSPLMMVSDGQSARALISYGAEVDLTTSFGSTALMLAAGREGCSEVIDILSSHGAAVNLRDMSGWTALMRASDSTLASNLTSLLAAGSDVNAMTFLGESALLLASSRKDNSEVLAQLLQSGAVVNQHNGQGMTPLMRVCITGDVAMARVLLQEHAVLDLMDEKGFTALLHTAYSLPIDHKSWPASATAHAAYTCRYIPVFELLLSRGADYSTRNHAGQTAWDLVVGKCSKCEADIKKLLPYDAWHDPEQESGNEESDEEKRPARRRRASPRSRPRRVLQVPTPMRSH